MTLSTQLKIAFVGNCQAPGIIASLKALLPDALIEGWHFGAQAVTGEELLARLPDFNVVIKNLPDGQAEKLFDLDRLRQLCTKVVVIPPITFTGFHPDITYIMHEGRALPGIVGDYHSAIISAAFALGLPAERVPALFNGLIYASLGYFDAFPQAKHEIIAQHQQHGYDIKSHFAHWLVSGAFMHTINHPRIDVLSTLATMAAIRTELVRPDTPIPQGVNDDLEASGTWPTYPELGHRIGTAGSTVFIRGRHEVRQGESREIGLREAVDISYRRLAETPDLDLSQGRVAFVRERLKELVIVGSG